MNAIAPGFIATEMTYRNNSADDVAALVGQVPAVDSVPPQRSPRSSAFFASARNSFVTGQVIVCDGGYSCL